jgi:hypothetical protein
MKSWILFFLGTLAYFLIRYANRKDKTPAFSFKFWIRDNWPELSVALILDIAAMIILMDADTNITEWLRTFLPPGIVVSAKLLASLGCGLGLGAGAYGVFKKKLKNVK